jgi:lysophospholipase L1-like esterase
MMRTGHILLLVANAVAAQPPQGPLKWLQTTPALDAALLRMEAGPAFTAVHFGDSHVQGGRFTGEVRRSLQARFGGAGRGLLFPYGRARSFDPAGFTSEAAGAWTGINVVGLPPPGTLGLLGYALHGTAPAASLRIGWKEELVSATPLGLRIWHSCAPGAPLPLVDGTPATTATCRAGGWTTSTWELRPGATGFHLTLAGTGPWTLHGFELADGAPAGIRYHAAGVVGAQFTQLAAQAALVLEQLQALEPDLVVFSYGTNEAYAKDLDTLAYAATVRDLLATVRSRMPNTAVVVMTPPDTRAQGRIPPFQPAVLRALRTAAASTGTAFFDLHAAMGGDGALAAWHAAGLAARDRLHFTPDGYALQGRLFAAALLERLQQLQPLCCPDLGAERVALIERLEQLERTAAAAPPAPAEHHVVRAGESVYLIARRNGLDHRTVLRLNGLSERSVIRPGQRIRLR